MKRSDLFNTNLKDSFWIVPDQEAGNKQTKSTNQMTQAAHLRNYAASAEQKNTASYAAISHFLTLVVHKPPRMCEEC